MSLADQSQQWFPTSVQVTVLQAKNLRIKGKNGTNDAYAIMQVAKDKFSTSVAEKCVAPVWKEEATFDLPLFHQGNADRCTLHVHVMHRALVGPDKLLGQAVVNLLDLEQNKARNKTEWSKLLDKSGKADKERGEVLLNIQFMKNNMTASMFDLSSQEKSRSRMGKLKDKLRIKKKEGLSDSASAVVPSVTQVMTDSEGEEEGGEGGGGATSTPKKKKNKLKSLFAPKSNLQRNISQSMSTLGPLPERDSALGSSRSSGLNVDSPEGKKKFKFLTHKRTGSSDSKSSLGSFSGLGQPKQSSTLPSSNLCVNGSHVYTEEAERKPSRASSTFSLSSSGHGSMEELRKSSAPSGNSFTTSVESLRASRSHLQAEEEEEEEQRRRRIREEERRKLEEQEEEEEEQRMEKERAEREQRRIQEERERMEREAEEGRRRKIEEERRRLKEEEEERLRKEEEEKRLMEEERRAEEERQRREQERLMEEERMRREQERLIEEEKKRAEEERQRREQERLMEEERRRAEEERQKIEQERLMEEERIRREQERLIEEEKKRAEEERQRKEQERLMEEERRKVEEETVRREQERLMEEERRRAEEERLREEQERRREEEERIRRLEEEERERMEREKEEERQRIEKERREEERRRIEEEEERIRIEEERRRDIERLEEEEQRRIEEEERLVREERERIWREEEEKLEIGRQIEEEIKREEDKRKAEEEEERIRVEEQLKKEEERKMLEEERVKREKEERERIEREEDEERRSLEEERVRKEEERRLEEEKEMIRQEEERKRIEKEEENAREEQERQEEKERLRAEAEERIKRAEEEERRKVEEKRVRMEEEERLRREDREERLREEEEERNMREEEEERQKKLEEQMKRKEEEEEEKPKKLEEEKEKTRLEQERDEFSQESVAANPFEEISSTHLLNESLSPNPFEEASITANPFEDSSVEVGSPYDHLSHSSKVSTVKPSLTSVGFPSQTSPTPSNPFLTDDSEDVLGSDNGSTENLSRVWILSGDRAEKKRRAPSPPVRKPTPVVAPRTSTPDSGSQPLHLPVREKEGGHRSPDPPITRQDKRPAPQPPTHLKKPEKTKSVEDTRVGLAPPSPTPPGSEKLALCPSSGNENSVSPAPSLASQVFRNALQNYGLSLKGSAKGEKIKSSKSSRVEVKRTDGTDRLNTSVSSSIIQPSPSTNPFLEPTVSKHNKGPAPKPTPTLSESSPLKKDPKGDPAPKTDEHKDTQHKEISTTDPHRNTSDISHGHTVEEPRKLDVTEHLREQIAKPEDQSREVGEEDPGETAYVMAKAGPVELTRSHDAALESHRKDVQTLPKPDALSSDVSTESAKRVSEKKMRAPLPPTPKKQSPQSSDPHSFTSADVTEPAKKTPLTPDANEPISVKSTDSGGAPPSVATVSPSKQRVRLSARVDALPLSTANGATEDLGKADESMLSSSRRPHAVKPLSAQEPTPAPRTQAKQEQSPVRMAESARTHGKAIKAPQAEPKGPYSQLTQEELISLVLRQQEQLAQRSSKIQELEEYIDNLVLRVIEEQPSILMSLNSPRKGT